MSEAVSHRMSLDEFWEWQTGQEDRYELIDGEPRATAGAQQQHDRIVTNALIAIGVHVRGGPCRVFTADQTVVTKSANGRRPDLGVDCGPLEPTSMQATSPRIVFEVLSRSTRTLDQVGKLDEYKQVDSMEQIVLVDPNEPSVIFWPRSADRSWLQTILTGRDAILPLGTIGLDLPLSELYAGLDMRPRPRVVPPS